MCLFQRFTLKSKQTINVVSDNIEAHNSKRRMLMTAGIERENMLNSCHWFYIQKQQQLSCTMETYGPKYVIGHAKYLLSLIQYIFKNSLEQNTLVIHHKLHIFPGFDLLFFFDVQSFCFKKEKERKETEKYYFPFPSPSCNRNEPWFISKDYQLGYIPYNYLGFYNIITHTYNILGQKTNLSF